MIFLTSREATSSFYPIRCSRAARRGASVLLASSLIVGRSTDVGWNSVRGLVDSLAVRSNKVSMFLKKQILFVFLAHRHYLLRRRDRPTTSPRRLPPRPKVSSQMLMNKSHHSMIETAQSVELSTAAPPC
jgi:hypothetical protein